MKTNVMIRVDATNVEAAKMLNLNISKICDEAIASAVEEESRPFGIITNQQITYDSDLHYSKREGTLGISFVIRNTGEENVIFDRLIYNAFIFCIDQAKMLNPKGLHFKGVFLERATIQKGGQIIFSEPLTKDFRPEELCTSGISDLTFRVFSSLFVDGKHGIMKCGAIQQMNEDGIMPEETPKIKEV